MILKKGLLVAFEGIDGVDGVDIIHNKIINVIDDVVKHYYKRHEQYSLFCNNLKAC